MFVFFKMAKARRTHRNETTISLIETSAGKLCEGKHHTNFVPRQGVAHKHWEKSWPPPHTSFTIFTSIRPVFPYRFLILIINQIYSYIKMIKWEFEHIRESAGIVELEEDCYTSLTCCLINSFFAFFFQYSILVLDLNWFKLDRLLKTHPKIILPLLVTRWFVIILTKSKAKAKFSIPQSTRNARFKPNMIGFRRPVHRLRFLSGEKH